MAGVAVNVDGTKPELLAEAWRVAPRQLLHNLALAYQDIGRGDIEALRTQQLSGGRFLNVRNAGTKKAFKFRATDPEKITEPNQLFVNEYTRWPGARFHDKGGTITGRGSMWILTAAARGSTGKRKLSDRDIKQGIAEGTFRIAWLPSLRTTAVVNTEAGQRGSRFRKFGRIIALMVKSVRMKKRLDWDGLIRSRQGVHTQLIDGAVQRTFEEAYGNA